MIGKLSRVRSGFRLLVCVDDREVVPSPYLVVPVIVLGGQEQRMGVMHLNHCVRRHLNARIERRTQYRNELELAERSLHVQILPAAHQ